ncbi:class I SAM-dependent methyltransferase [Marinicella sediminis]|uniref:Calmodulin-lysine N-methyltransferase n=1 Tax=Marinicella sediminis TaxID=1792834 RepID=A0ABV7JB44_9GAMM|nr:methyltransferase domain-containing protein [Marinicella sediminis]
MSTYRIKYQTIEFTHQDIHIKTLRDRQQYADPDGVAAAFGISSAQWPLFGVVWESSQVLARILDDKDTRGLRILEVGCGIGLSSLLLNARHEDITATDHHPMAGEFLLSNTALNDGEVIPFLRTGWDNQHTGLGRFNLIVGSDLLYETEHIHLLSQFIKQHAKPNCEVIIVDPGRGLHSKFSKAMTTLGFAHSQTNAPNEDPASEPFKGKILRYLSGE